VPSPTMPGTRNTSGIIHPDAKPSFQEYGKSISIRIGYNFRNYSAYVWRHLEGLFGLRWVQFGVQLGETVWAFRYFIREIPKRMRTH
jgi:hypothetical protein